VDDAVGFLLVLVTPEDNLRVSPNLIKDFTAFLTEEVWGKYVCMDSNLYTLFQMSGNSPTRFSTIVPNFFGIAGNL
jgi:hypothetical protein